MPARGDVVFAAEGGGGAAGFSTAAGRGAGGTAAALPPFMKAVTFAISSSVRLASAEPFPVTPAFVQMSTSTLLSSFSCFANA